MKSNKLAASPLEHRPIALSSLCRTTTTTTTNDFPSTLSPLPHHSPNLRPPLSNSLHRSGLYFKRNWNLGDLEYGEWIGRYGARESSLRVAGREPEGLEMEGGRALVSLPLCWTKVGDAVFAARGRKGSLAGHLQLLNR